MSHAQMITLQFAVTLDRSIYYAWEVHVWVLSLMDAMLAFRMLYSTSQEAAVEAQQLKSEDRLRK